MKVGSAFSLSASALLLLLLSPALPTTATTDSSNAPAVTAASDAAVEQQADDATQRQRALLQKVQELAAHGLFVETFEEEEVFDGRRWFKSTHKKYTGQEAAVDEYTVRTGHVTPDKGLVLEAPAKHYGLAVKLDAPLSIDGSEGKKELVVQYEVKLQKGLTCGGAYVKLLRADATTDFRGFSDATPFVIMFGPDKCGSSDKVHFIFQHKHPTTGVYEEKHLLSPPSSKSDRLAHLYTLVVRDADNSYEMFIDQSSVSNGSLYENFTPAVLPDKEIDDPNDSKPSDWVDDAQMRDPNAVKPADWDEDAPARIPDVDAVKPAGWLDDEPALIDDPNAPKPTDWDDDDDGEWVTPQVPNPKCDSAPGCGVWERSTKANPAFKGKWYAPLVPNPAFKGEWEPRKIPNPAYFEDPHPAHLDPIGALAVEVWTMSDGITFDNFWLGNDLAKAQEFANATWVPKHKLETEDQERQREKERIEAEERKAKDGGVFRSVEVLFNDFVEFTNENPLVGLGSAAVVVLLLLFSAFYVCCGKADELLAPEKDSDAEAEDESESADDSAQATAAKDEKKAGDSGDEQKLRQRKKKAPKAD